jgi:hypothetical protein
MTHKEFIKIWDKINLKVYDYMENNIDYYEYFINDFYLNEKDSTYYVEVIYNLFYTDIFDKESILILDFKTYDILGTHND